MRLDRLVESTALEDYEMRPIDQKIAPFTQNRVFCEVKYPLP